MLAYTRAEGLLDPLGVRLVYRPYYPQLTLPDRSSAKVRYVVEDVLRYARAYGLRLNPGPYVDLSLACRGFLFAKERGAERLYQRELHRARWRDAEDISQPETLCRAAQACGLSPSELADAIESPKYAERMEQETAAAAEAGVFGIPFLQFEGQSFWGNDRLEWLVEAVRKRASQ
jgi:2-hydroxychromene-2-carboxylate isomerase